ncbi:D-ribose pyranase [Halanaerobium salsuginis]|jgi:D-ribose pyranase|uniref:D-ribose pyranase n=1 Tax=Halanaerobium salsuginis TaxID=29563 RepID=A0A1I4K6P6_9FIRM|nr:D-ribose pyranase [Halanaerobium salsuginis]SFL74289.1 ribose transport protein RbsD [Halanaerobium salsuginis]
MKRGGVINSSLSRVIAELGHTDGLTIADAGLPIASNTARIDLALEKGYPEFNRVLKAILGDLIIEKVIMAAEIKTASPNLHQQILDLLPAEIELEYCSHTEFKTKTNQTKAVVRTGEITPYANIILISGVDF